MLHNEEKVVTILELRSEFSKNLNVLHRKAACYFSSISNPNSWAWDEDRLTHYEDFKKAYLTLYRQLNNLDLLMTEEMGEQEKKELIIAAKKIAMNTALLLNDLAKNPFMDHANFAVNNHPINKLQVIETYHAEYKVACGYNPFLRKLGNVVTRFTMAAMSFVVGAACGAYVGLMASLIAAAPTAPLVVAGGAVIGGIIGAIEGCYHSKNKIFACFKQPPQNILYEKAEKLGNSGVAFFPPPKSEKSPLLPQPTVSQHLFRTV